MRMEYEEGGNREESYFLNSLLPFVKTFVNSAEYCQAIHLSMDVINPPSFRVNKKKIGCI